jgi:type IV pilus assembly protein PilE
MRGFTLIELMVVVAIIAILAAIAVPSYERYAYRARRAEGQQLLLHIANAQERYYATYNRYGDLATIGYATTGSMASEHGYYLASVSIQDDGQAYTATAEPMGVQQGDACGSLSITDTGAKRPDVNDIDSNRNGRCW